MNQYWTAVIVRDGTYECRDHFGSFSPSDARSEIEILLPTGTSIVALIPGKHARNSVLFNDLHHTSDGMRFINPYDPVKI